MQPLGGGWMKAAGPGFHAGGAGFRAKRQPCSPAVSGHITHSRNPGRWLRTGAIPWRPVSEAQSLPPSPRPPPYSEEPLTCPDYKGSAVGAGRRYPRRGVKVKKRPSGFLAKWRRNGEELKENVDMGDTRTPTVTMEITGDISESRSTCIAVETEVTENGTIHEGKVNVTAERRYSWLNDQQLCLATCRLTADSTVVENVKEATDGNHHDNANGIQCPFKIEDLDHTAQASLAFESMCSSYEMPEAIYAIIHKDHMKDSSAAVLGGVDAKSATIEDLELGQDITTKLTAAAIVAAEIDQEEMLMAFQTTKEAGNEIDLSTITRSKEFSPDFSSLSNLNEGMLKSSLEANQKEGSIGSLSPTDFSKLTMESLTSLAVPNDDEGLMDPSATGLNGPIKPYLTSNGNPMSNKGVMYQRESEAIPLANQNEFFPSATLMQYVDEVECAFADRFKKRSNDAIHESWSNGNTTSPSKKLLPEIMEVENRSLKSNPNQYNEVITKSNNTETQSAEHIQTERSQTKAAGNENIDTEHVDFAVARRQWLLLEEINRAHSQRPQANLQKNKTKRVINDNTDYTFDTKPIKVANLPHSAAFSEEQVQSCASVEIRMDEVESWRGLTNLNRKQSMVVLQGNSGAMRDLEQMMLLNIVDFSTCSEGSDSGLDDSMCRSEADNLTDTLFQSETSSSGSITYSKSETPIEREIRLGVKREESLRKARGIKKHTFSEEYVEIRTRPLIFHPVPAPAAKGKNNQFAEMQMQREILLERQREEDLVLQGKVKGTYDKSLIPEIEERRKFFEQHYPFPLPLNSKIFMPHINTSTSFLSAPSAMKKYPSSNEMNDGHFRLENGTSMSTGDDKAGVADAVMKCKYPTVEMANVVILETPDMILQHTTDFALSSITSPQAEEILQNNPFFKLRSHGSQSILSLEIREVLQREEELRKQRCYLHGAITAAESSLPSSTEADHLPPVDTSSKSMPQDCSGPTLRGSYMC
ncbi:hypothetical protein scyTo_0000675 [Scyliorhinus torazame]|uniref:Uncharacterized protein n=1 Tax=Scyliorhinus torazame TaxID=75743 RepID=A0A401P1T2_SCYTO|nr:hypothetical protein [Scyliorhinus torazame]